MTIKFDKKPKVKIANGKSRKVYDSIPNLGKYLFVSKEGRRHITPFEKQYWGVK